MGAYFCLAPCGSCGQVFSFNPHLVPSLRRSPQAEKEPICRGCITLANPIRKENGLPEIVPLPGAYEAVNEGIWGDDS